MIVYRVSLDSIFEENGEITGNGIVGDGWGSFNNGDFQNTFNEEDRNGVYFFKYAIDAYSFLRKELVDYDYTKYFSVFDIPEEKLTEGFGFYPAVKVCKEYVCKKEDLSKDMIKFTTTNDRTICEYVLKDLDEAFCWYSTVGKACAMSLDRDHYGDDRTNFYAGGFIHEYGDKNGFIEYALCEEINIPYDIFMGELKRLATEYYKELDFFEYIEKEYYKFYFDRNQANTSLGKIQKDICTYKTCDNGQQAGEYFKLLEKDYSRTPLKNFFSFNKYSKTEKSLDK